MGFLTSDRAQRDGRVTFVQLLTGIAGFIAFSVIGGVLLAGLALPAVTVAGTAAKGSEQIFEALPKEFDNVKLPESSYIYASDGETLLATFYLQNRKVMPLEDISPWLQKAVVAVEDNRFWQHNGVDGEGLLRAAYYTFAADETQGASTITQQLVKNLYFTTHRSYVRKALEIAITPAAELVLGKDRILELYLNVIEWGPGVFGAYAAAEHHYSKSPADLTREQAARLAAVIPDPLNRTPARMSGYAETIQGRMRQMGW